MRVLHVIPSLATRTGGPPVAVVESSCALAREGVETVIFATDLAGPAAAPHHARVTPADLPDGAGALDVRLFRARPPRRLAYAPALWRALREEAPRCDVVHIHSLFLFPQFAAYRAASRRGVPYVVSPRGALDPHLRRRGRAVKRLGDALWGGEMLRGAARLHLTSDEEARLLGDVAPAVPRAVVPNGIRWDAFQRLPDARAFRARHLGGHAGPLVLYLGRLSHKKGLDLLVRAFAATSAAAPDARLAIAGPDDEGLAPRLAQLARHSGVGDRVRFTGMLRGDDRLGALAAADVWALPSHSENFGIAAVEAMAAGCAVVLSPAVNIAPDVAAAGAGIVAPLDDASFAGAIGSLLGDAAARAGLGRAAREHARRYDWSAVAPRLAGLYADAATAGRRAA